MPRLRISIAGLVGLIAVMALWMASLRAATVWWTTAASTVTLGVLLSAALGAAFRSGAERAFWTGFCLFGTVYLVLANWDWLGAQFGHDLTGGLGDLAVWANPDPTRPTAAASTPSGAAFTNPYFVTMQDRAIRIGNFVQIGRMVLALLFAMAGGTVARTFAEREAEGRAVESKCIEPQMTRINTDKIQ